MQSKHHTDSGRTTRQAALSPIRILRIIDRLNIGGPAKHVVWLTAGLNAHEFETVLVTGTVAQGEGDMSYFARAAGVEPLVIDEMSRELGLRDILVTAKLLRLLWRLNPHIVHTHKAKAGAVGRLAAAMYKWMTPSALWLRPRPCHIVHTYHGHIFHSYYGAAKSKLFLLIERALARLCTDRIITISQQQRREISEQFRIGRPDQFRVVPLGIDVDEATEGPHRVRQEFGIARDERLIGIVGRLCEIKNHAMFLESARLVGKRGGPNLRVRFIIIGDGHLRGKLESLSRHLGIADRVLFAGFRKDALSLYPDLDVVALTSLNEGTPLTLIEAMCSGRAVAATEVGGVIDIMGARQAASEGFSIWDHGVTAPSRDVEAFARALQYLIERPALCRDMGERGQMFVKSRLSKERLVSDVQELYGELSGLKAVTSPEALSFIQP
jgi:glycosyltransferase involved in cell wall biosynthesis